MSREILLSVDLSVNDGELTAFQGAVNRLVAFVEATEPGVRFYKFYLADDGRSARSVHIYSDLDALKVHTDVAKGRFQEVLSHAALIMIEVLGDVTIEQLEEIGLVKTPALFQGGRGFARL